MRGNNMLRFLKNLALWFVALGFSLLVSNVFDLLEQGKAFFYAILGINAIYIFLGLFFAVIQAISNSMILNCKHFFLRIVNGNIHFQVTKSYPRFRGGYLSYENGIPIVDALVRLMILVCSLLVAWAAARYFNIDFYAIYHFITFAQCLNLKIQM